MDVTYEPLNLVGVIRWPIDDFPRVCDSQEYLDSEHFSLKGLSSKFYLQVCFNNLISYYLKVADMGTENKVECTVSFWLENCDGTESARTQEKTVKFPENEQHLEQLPNVSINLVEAILNSAFFKSGKAIVCCGIIYQVSDKIFGSSNSDIDFRQKLWDSHVKGFHDIVTIKVEGKELKASKAVLTTNSKVFERTFLTTNCIEAQTGIIEIRDITASVMEGLIQFMYIGKVENIDLISIDLFKAADKYKVEGLMCTRNRKKTLFDVIVLAYSYKCDILKRAVSKFCMTNSKSGHFAELICRRKRETGWGDH